MGTRGVAAALEARHISKSFAGVRALDDAALAIASAEVHGLVGENGSGKSTLIKVLAGHHVPAPGGALAIDERAVALPLRPGQPRELGLRFVHQELGLIPSLSVVENLRLEELAAARRRRILWSRERRAARDYFERLGLELDPRAIVEDLQPAARAQLAIARALAGSPIAGADGHPIHLVAFDETPAYLPIAERERLFAHLRALASSGVGVLLVSHDLGEAKAISDRVTVMREGRKISTVFADAVQTGELAELMVGRRISSPRAHAGTHPAVPRGHTQQIAVRGLTGDSVAGASLEVSPGEIVGLTGPAASGFSAVPYLIFGAGRCSAGRLTLGREYDLTAMTPHRALRAGIALLPGDRARGIVDSLSVEANLTLPALDRHQRGLRLRRRQLAADASLLLREYGVQPDAPAVAMETLSGGNQQKVLLAKWTQLKPTLLLLHEPTRGIDIGARAEIIASLRSLAATGVAMICASTDPEELAALCERVLLFEDGLPVRELAGEEIEVRAIAAASAGQVSAPPAHARDRSAEH